MANYVPMKLKECYRASKQGKIGKFMRHQTDSFYNAYADLFTGNVLDAGCGRSAVHTVNLNRCRYIGVDLSYPGLLENSRIDFGICADLGALPLRDACINLMICNDVVEHLHNPELFFKEASRTLVGGGRLLISTPNLYGYVTLLSRLLPRVLLEFIYKIWKKQKMPSYPFVYKANTKRAVYRLAFESGLTVESVVYVNTVPHWFYNTPLLATLLYAYGKLASKVKMDFLLNCMNIVLRKD